MDCSSWTESEVGEWLESNGFGDYKDKFLGECSTFS
jgi:hypothetical protein